MALLQCPECGRQVSSQASSCPGCGHPLRRVSSKRTRRKRKKTAILIAIIVGAVLILGAIAAIIFLVMSGNSKYDKELAKASKRLLKAYEEQYDNNGVLEDDRLEEISEDRDFVMNVNLGYISYLSDSINSLKTTGTMEEYKYSEDDRELAELIEDIGMDSLRFTLLTIDVNKGEPGAEEKLNEALTKFKEKIDKAEEML